MSNEERKLRHVEEENAMLRRVRAGDRLGLASIDLLCCDRGELVGALGRASKVDSVRACSNAHMRVLCEALELPNCAVRELYLVCVSDAHAEMLSSALETNTCLQSILLDGSHAIDWAASSAVVSALGVFYIDDTFNADTDWERIAMMPSLRTMQFRSKDEVAMATIRRMWPNCLESEMRGVGWTMFTRINQHN